ncbi:ankyrin-1 [Colletotrichum salicis]|uniref:Ankyrin-1 n=1 Tax=Colletotrichum salicis TaxID=1209931 RepID=A0A135S8F0_9PEZI|nr:ankyrin-1 [Colletotrichum salicis]
MEAETRRGLRAWLAFPPPTDLFHESKQKWLEETCDWVLRRREFVEWLAPNAKSVNTKSLLWINGPAGLGKTVPCASIVEHLSETSQTPVAYFFLSSDFESRDNPYAAIRSWVHQPTSCNQVAYHLVRDKWLAQHEEFATQIEIGQGDGKSLRGFLGSITRAVADTYSHILVVSQDEPEIRSGMLEQCGELKIVPEDVQSDVARYSRSIVDKKLPKKDDATREGIYQMLAHRSQGQFLWFKLDEDSLRSWKNKKQLEVAIEEIPSGLNHIYQRNWARISKLPEPIRDRAYSLLQWAVFSIRPPTVNEISEAMLIE